MLVQAVKERLDHAAFAVPVSVHPGMNAQALRVAKHAADGEHTLEVVRQEIALPGGLTFLHPASQYLGVRLAVGRMPQHAQTGHIRNGFQVEDQYRPGHG